MKSFRKQKPSSDPDSSASSPKTVRGPTIQEKLDAYNSSYHGKPNVSQVPSDSKLSKKTNSRPSRDSQNTGSSKDVNSTWGRSTQSSFKSTKSKKHDRRLEFQQTRVQDTRGDLNASKREGSRGGDSVSTGDVRKRLSSYRSKMGNSYKNDPSFLVPLLAAQAYHIPGNSWGQDWRQFMANNHPVFGIFLHHKLHPIKSCTRFVALIGSIIFGMFMTNLFYLFYLWNPNFDQIVLSVTMDSGRVQTLTTGMLLLWTLGSGIHASFNLCLWYIAACSCCRAGGCCESRACCPSLGKHLIRGVVIMILVLAVLVVLMRVAIENELDQSAESLSNNTTSTGGFDFFFTAEAWDFNIESEEEFDFVLGYLVQMLMSLFVFYPLLATILMTGILGCHRLPILGGRPYEVALHEKKKARKSRIHDWEMSGHPTIVTSGSGSSGDGARNHSFLSENDSNTEDDIEIIWTSRARKDFYRK